MKRSNSVAAEPLGVPGGNSSVLERITTSGYRTERSMEERGNALCYHHLRITGRSFRYELVSPSPITISSTSLDVGFISHARYLERAEAHFTRIHKR